MCGLTGIDREHSEQVVSVGLRLRLGAVVAGRRFSGDPVGSLTVVRHEDVLRFAMVDGRRASSFPEDGHPRFAWRDAGDLSAGDVVSVVLVHGVADFGEFDVGFVDHVGAHADAVLRRARYARAACARRCRSVLPSYLRGGPPPVGSPHLWMRSRVFSAAEPMKTFLRVYPSL